MIIIYLKMFLMSSSIDHVYQVQMKILSMVKDYVCIALLVWTSLSRIHFFLFIDSTLYSFVKL